VSRSNAYENLVMEKNKCNLSILICGITERLGRLPLLMGELERQKNSIISKYDGQKNIIEILALVDDRAMTVGKKRNLLVQASCGDYVAFVDDDDFVSTDYLERIYEATRKNVDVVTFPVAVTIDGGATKMCYYSMNYLNESNDYDHYWRWPNHLCAMKRSIVIANPYEDISFGEDSAFAKKVRPVLKTELSASNHPLYRYRFSSKDTATQK
jgi:hypothetical protein